MPDVTQEGLAARGLRVKAETLAKEVHAIVAADRWKGRALDAAPPEKWHRLRPETQQVWIDEATRILAALEDTGEPALIREAEARGMERAANIAEADAKQLTEEALQWRADNMPFAAQFAEEQAKAGPRIAASIRAAKAAP